MKNKIKTLLIMLEKKEIKIDEACNVIQTIFDKEHLKKMDEILTLVKDVQLLLKWLDK